MAAKKKQKTAIDTKAKTPSPFSPKQIKIFVEEVRAEFFKIVWPDKKITLGLTGIVVALSFVISLYLGSVDLLIGKAVSSFLR